MWHPWSQAWYGVEQYHPPSLTCRMPPFHPLVRWSDRSPADRIRLRLRHVEQEMTCWDDYAHSRSGGAAPRGLDPGSLVFLRKMLVHMLIEQEAREREAPHDRRN